MLPAVNLGSEETESKTWDLSWSELCACAMEIDYIQTSVAWTTQNYGPELIVGHHLDELGCCPVTGRTLMKNPFCFEDGSGPNPVASL